MRILARPTPIVMDGEVGLAVPVETSEGQRLGSDRGQGPPAEVGTGGLVQVLKNPSFQEKLGLTAWAGRICPICSVSGFTLGVEGLAQKTGIGILTFRGEMVLARLWE